MNNEFNDLGVTYSQLRDILFSLGFVRVPTTLYVAYSKPECDALIVLPLMANYDIISVAHLIVIKNTLVGKGIIGEDDVFIYFKHSIAPEPAPRFFTQLSNPVSVPNNVKLSTSKAKYSSGEKSSTKRSTSHSLENSVTRDARSGSFQAEYVKGTKTKPHTIAGKALTGDTKPSKYKQSKNSEQSESAKQLNARSSTTASSSKMNAQKTNVKPPNKGSGAGPTK
jgi:hypothetical protein